MFETLDIAEPDAILGLSEAFARDPNPQKINLAVGVYKDADGITPLLAAVKEAERRLLQNEASKSYLPIDGDPEYDRLVGELLLGEGHPVLAERRSATAQTPGGTGALRVAADYLHVKHPRASVWLPAPTWPNHPAIFEAAGVPTKRYAWFDAAANGLAFDAMRADLQQVPPGDVVLLHGCCHNPTGVDPSPEQWRKIAEMLAQRRLMPLLDFAYQGFGEGLDEDAAGLRTLAERAPEMMICNSFSKTFGLYNERVGALTVVAASSAAAEAVLSHVKRAIRRNYSNPPAHGGRIVAAVLGDADLRRQWKEQLAAMRDRINAMRRLFVETLAAQGAAGDYGFIGRQRGMFSFSGMTPEQVRELREHHSIYLVGSGRINVAGMTPANMNRLCEAVRAVTEADSSAT